MNADIIYCILSLLKPIDILNCALINKQFQTISKNELIWKQICETDFVSIMINYYEGYRKYGIMTNFLKRYDLPIQKYKILINLKNLHFGGKQIKRIPSEIGLLVNLEYIELSDNKLKSLPNEICSLTNLCRLCISRNQLESIPENIGLLTNLQYLDLFRNNLESIPVSISSLTKLERLSINHNNFDIIPQQFSSLTKLRVFEIDTNQKFSVPHNLLDKISIIQRYFQDIS
jgi:Leucine-rich repeat (LRR) protein